MVFDFYLLYAFMLHVQNYIRDLCHFPYKETKIYFSKKNNTYYVEGDNFLKFFV